MSNYNEKNHNASNFHFEDELSKWISDEMLGYEFVDVLVKLFYEKSIELMLFRNQLYDRSASVILFLHSYAVHTIGKTLKIQDSFVLAKALYEMDIPPARIDIGRLNFEWTNDRQKYAGPKAFIQDKLKSFIDKEPSFSKPRDVVLYGFGRIGRLVARELIQMGNGSQLRLRAIVTRSSQPEDLMKRAHLFRHDSIHGPFRGIAVEDLEQKSMYANGHTVQFLSTINPEDVSYTQYGIHDAILIDNTGIVRDREGLERHLKAEGISKVLLTAPGKGNIPNIVYGVNHHGLDLVNESIFSAASCTTNAIVPALKVIEETLGIEKGHIETIHSYTNDQNLLDNFHKKARRGRAAPANMVITNTGADTAAAKAIPSLKGKLTANAVRIPTPNVSLAILHLCVGKPTSVDEVNLIMKNAALHGDFVEQIRYSTSTESVSSDYIGDPATLIFDSPSTKVSADGRCIVIYVWYDNEYGYSVQVVRLAKFIAKVERYRYQ
ncbi:MAG: glyceraldehyde-3-phosphate dehydrogenase [Lentimicrobiaceae bacterium]|nr:glyceraldehyde-3-phosphate dehydrogenase [Lentimicrobiaceae bacterium]